MTIRTETTAPQVGRSVASRGVVPCVGTGGGRSGFEPGHACCGGARCGARGSLRRDLSPRRSLKRRSAPRRPTRGARGRIPRLLFRTTERDGSPSVAPHTPLARSFARSLALPSRHTPRSLARSLARSLVRPLPSRHAPRELVFFGSEKDSEFDALKTTGAELHYRLRRHEKLLRAAHLFEVRRGRATMTSCGHTMYESRSSRAAHLC